MDRVRRIKALGGKISVHVISQAFIDDQRLIVDKHQQQLMKQDW